MLQKIKLWIFKWLYPNLLSVDLKFKDCKKSRPAQCNDKSQWTYGRANYDLNDLPSRMCVLYWVNTNHFNFGHFEYEDHKWHCPQNISGGQPDFYAELYPPYFNPKENFKLRR